MGERKWIVLNFRKKILIESVTLDSMLFIFFPNIWAIVTILKRGVRGPGWARPECLARGIMYSFPCLMRLQVSRAVLPGVKQWKHYQEVVNRAGSVLPQVIEFSPRAGSPCRFDLLGTSLLRKASAWAPRRPYHLHFAAIQWCSLRHCNPRSPGLARLPT